MTALWENAAEGGEVPGRPPQGVFWGPLCSHWEGFDQEAGPEHSLLSARTSNK